MRYAVPFMSRKSVAAAHGDATQGYCTRTSVCGRRSLHARERHPLSTMADPRCLVTARRTCAGARLLSHVRVPLYRDGYSLILGGGQRSAS
jgi:hypothetical protein